MSDDATRDFEVESELFVFFQPRLGPPVSVRILPPIVLTDGLEQAGEKTDA